MSLYLFSSRYCFSTLLLPNSRFQANDPSFYEASMGKRFSPAVRCGGEECKLRSQTVASCGTLGMLLSLSVSQYQPRSGMSVLNGFHSENFLE